MTPDYPKPIAPPPELVQQWWEQADQYQDDPKTYFDYVATEAAQWGADQELDACCEWIANVPDFYTGSEIDLRAARRPKPPSLKARLTKAIQDKDLDTAFRLVEGLDDSL
ncbi:MAG: hypothetical protein EBR82_58100 [Caulobacteraceae bacterium]|nr:hypothetical protein [Caulobacteraceae bacterium]